MLRRGPVRQLRPMPTGELAGRLVGQACQIGCVAGGRPVLETFRRLTPAGLSSYDVADDAMSLTFIGHFGARARVGRQPHDCKLFKRQTRHLSR